MSEQSSGTTRMGKWMITLAWVGVLVLLTILFTNVLDHQRNPNQNISTNYVGGTKEIVLDSSLHGHYVASGEINNSPVVFLVDTGASFVSVSASLAKKIGLERGAAMRSITANGEITTYATELAEVSLGDITVNNVRASINPHMSGNEVLLGMSFLRRLEVTHKDGQLTIRQ